MIDIKLQLIHQNIGGIKIVVKIAAFGQTAKEKNIKKVTED